MTAKATREPFQTVSEIRRFFRTARTPVHFVSATAFNLLGIDRWVPTLRYLDEGARTIRLLEASAA